MASLWVTLTFFFLIAAAGVSLYAAFAGSHRVFQNRFAELALKMRLAQGAFEEGEIEGGLARMLFHWAVQRMPAPKLDTPQGEKLQQSLVQAGFTRSNAARVFQAVRVICAVGLGALLLLLSFLFGASGGQALVFGALGGAAGIFIPSYMLTRRARKRQGEIARQLSDVLDLLVVCVEAGLGLYEAIKVVGAEAERHGQAIGRELSMVAGEIAAGSSLGQALRSLSDRTAVEDIKPLAATLIQSEQLGAQIAPALHASSDALRTRRRLRAEEAAQKTSIKILFPLVLFVLPAMIMVIIGPAMVQIIHTLRH